MWFLSKRGYWWCVFGITECTNITITISDVHHGNTSFHSMLLTPYSRDLLEKPVVTQVVKNLPACYGTWRVITAFTGARHWALSWARCIQSTPSHFLSPRCILVLSLYICQSLQHSLLPKVFPTKILYAFLFSSTGATCLSHFIHLDLITQTIFGEVSFYVIRLKSWRT